MTFQDIEKRNFVDLKGYRKLVNCCNRAAKDKYDWVWIDTCCINKTSSAELSEAINSMYSWYSNSSVCYAYLEDLDGSKIFEAMKSATNSDVFRWISDLENLDDLVDDTEDLKLINELEDQASINSLEKSKWLSRGWTLQELIAPRQVIFFNGRWKEFGSKKSLARQISPITGIPVDVLLGKSPLFSTIAQRMSWASKRQTTREEDIAYCLMGLFDIHMQPIYGEGGEKAFLRLQQEILSRNSDQTLFLWSEKHEPYNLGLLATSPAAFCNEVDCFSWLYKPEFKPQTPYSPYSSLVPVQLRPATTSIDDKGHAHGTYDVDGGILQASLGSGGLQISLLQDNDSLHPTTRKGERAICLDVVAIGSTFPVHVGIWMASDTQYDPLSGFIANRLGNTRRAIINSAISSYFLIKQTVSFIRTNLSISQLQTSACGQGPPARFSFEGFNPQLSISSITTAEMDSFSNSLACLGEPFKRAGALVKLDHSCLECGEADEYEIVFGTRQKSLPWCSCVRTSRDLDIKANYNGLERLSARYRNQSSATFKCQKRIFVHILPNEDDGESYIIKISLAL